MTLVLRLRGGMFHDTSGRRGYGETEERTFSIRLSSISHDDVLMELKEVPGSCPGSFLMEMFTPLIAEHVGSSERETEGGS